MTKKRSKKKGLTLFYRLLELNPREALSTFARCVYVPLLFSCLSCDKRKALISGMMNLTTFSDNNDKKNWKTFEINVGDVYPMTLMPVPASNVDSIYLSCSFICSDNFANNFE